MFEFEYRAVDNNGVISTGLMNAVSDIDLEGRLSNIGYTLIEAKKKKDKKSVAFKFGRITRRNLISLTIYLHTAVSSGVPLLMAIEGFMTQLKDEKFKALLKSIAINIKDGDMFAEALRRYPDVFPNVYINLVEAGEMAGKLDETLANIISYLEGQEKIVESIRQATVYPAVVLSLVTALIIFIFSFVLPKFTAIFESTGVALPPSARFLIGVSAFFKNGWMFMIGGLIGVFFCSQFYPRAV